MYYSSVIMIFFFFFQAEDGIRDVAVTGVQTCALPILFPMMSSATRTWMNTVAGAPCRSTATCGFLIPSLSAGRPIVTAIGCGSRLGAGLGLTTNRGALLRSTMAVGWLSAACGAGCRALRDRD